MKRGVGARAESVRDLHKNFVGLDHAQFIPGFFFDRIQPFAQIADFGAQAGNVRFHLLVAGAALIADLILPRLEAQADNDAFALRDDKDADDALAGLLDFSDGYQRTQQRAPWFRRRALSALPELQGSDA